MDVSFFKVSYYNITGSEFLVLTHSFPRMVVHEKNKITKVTWCFWAVKYQYPSCTTNVSVAVIMNWCHVSAKSGTMLQQWG